jgi:hypothetical protein
VQRGKEERTSGAEALVSSAFHGTAEAVPFVKSGFSWMAWYRGVLYGTGRDAMLENLQPSLRDSSMVHANPGLRPGLSSTVPTGLDLVMVSRRHKSPRQLGFGWHGFSRIITQQLCTA